MSSSRQYSAAEFSIAYVYDYLDCREPWWNTNLQKATAKVKDKPSERRQACDELIKDITTAKTPAEKIRLVAKLGRTSRQTQMEKAEKSTIFSLVTSIATYLHLADRDPLFAKTVHAIRTSLIREVKQDHRKDYQEEIAARRSLVKEAESNMLADIHNKISTKDARSKRDLAFNELLDLQDDCNIAFAHIHNQFPSPLPPDDWRPFRLPEGVSVHPEIPLVYDNNYDSLYYWNEIHPNEERLKKFMGFLEKAATPESKSPANNTNPLLSLLANNKFPIPTKQNAGVPAKQPLDSSNQVSDLDSPRAQIYIPNAPLPRDEAIDIPPEEVAPLNVAPPPQRAFFDKNDAAWLAQHAIVEDAPVEEDERSLSPSLNANGASS